MDVQGDYDPIDAGGFIKINALRYVFYYSKLEYWNLQMTSEFYMLII
jgi:hypothetical protein